jgi:hypothetical protein
VSAARTSGWSAGTKLAVWLALVALGVVVTLVASARPANERRDIDIALSDAAYATTDGATIDVATIATFDWAEMHVFETCLGQDAIDRSLGFHFDTSRLRDAEWCGVIEVGRPLVVFTTGSRVDAWVIVNADRHRAFFFDTRPDGTLVAERTRAVFRVRVDASERDLALVP